jgi:hypothetical protein
MEAIDDAATPFDPAGHARPTRRQKAITPGPMLRFLIVPQLLPMNV